MDNNDRVRCIANTVYASKQCEKLRTKIIEQQSEKQLESSHLNVFRELCCADDSYTSSIACSTIVDLVKHDNFPPLPAISWLLSLLQSVKDIIEISTTICRLLLILNTKSIANGCRTANEFNLTSSVHPFVYILKQNKTNWLCVADCIVDYSFSPFQYPDNYAVFDSLLPVFKFILWSPDGTVDSGCKRVIWRFLLNPGRLLHQRNEFFVQTICWMRVENGNSVLDCRHFVDCVPHSDLNYEAYMVLWAVEIACESAKVGYDPEACLRYTIEVLSRSRHPEITDVVLLSFAETIGSCPTRFLHKLLGTSVELIKTYGVINDVIVWTIIGSVLPWIVHPLNELKQTNAVVNSLFAMLDERKVKYADGQRTKTLTDNKALTTFLSSNNRFHWAFTFVKILETVSMAELIDDLRAFCSSEDIKQNPSLSLFVTGVYLSTDDADIQCRCLDMLLDAIPGQQLPLILYSLSKTTDSKLHIKLLQSLTLTAVQKENIPPVLRIIRTLSSSRKPILVKLSIDLYTRLWMVQDRCYSFLYDQLMLFNSQSNYDFEMDIVVLSAIRDICTLKPEQHGKEWVALLSDLMSLYVERDLPVTLVYALESIIKLCAVNVVDVSTVYEELRDQPLFADKRPLVVCKLCEIIVLLFQEAVQGDRELQLVDDALIRIWEYVASSSDKMVVKAALKALSYYNFQEMPLKVIPQKYVKDLNISRQFVQKSTQNEPKPEDTISFVPGTLWLNFLQRTPALYQDDVCALLTSWLIDEVKTFSIPTVSLFRVIRGERTNANHLHDKSIFKAIVTSLKKACVQSKSNPITGDHLQTIIYSLIMLNSAPPKLLPPFSWYFLEAFIKHEQTELRKQTFRFLVKESVTSMSAKTCVENFLRSFDVDNCSADDWSELFENVLRWCGPVSSEIVAQFLSSSMQHILVRSVDSDGEKLYCIVCTCLNETLKRSDVDEKNRYAICRNLANWWQNAAVDSKLFEYLLIAAKELPAAYVDDLCSSQDAEIASPEDLYKVLRLRCAVALNHSINLFTWLKDCLTVTCRRLEYKALFFDCALDVLTENRSNSGTFQWLCQLQDHIHNELSEATDDARRFLFDVYIFCVVNSSSFRAFVREPTDIVICYKYFPQALVNVVGNEDASQVIEWLCYTCEIKNMDRDQVRVFSMGIVAFKNDPYLQKLPVWSRAQDATDYSLREKFTNSF